MPGTSIGGIKGAKTNKERYGEDYYRIMGSKGGQKPRPRWFALHPELAKEAGMKGGRVSKRTGIKNGEGKVHQPREYLYKGEQNER